MRCQRFSRPGARGVLKKRVTFAYLFSIGRMKSQLPTSACPNPSKHPVLQRPEVSRVSFSEINPELGDKIQEILIPIKLKSSLYSKNSAPPRTRRNTRQTVASESCGPGGNFVRV